MSNIEHFIRGGGFVMYPLLLISIGAVVVIVERLIAFKQYGAVPQSLLKAVLDKARGGKFDEANALCTAKSGPMAACLNVVLRHRNHPTREIERLVEEAGQEYFIRLERLLPVLDTTTTISPLLGLLGTIVGMIGAFNAIAAQSRHGSSDSVLAGVGEALYATATGLVIAVVCFAAYNYFAARLRTITSETEMAATKLINVLIERHHAERGSTSVDLPIDASRSEEGHHGVQTPSRA